MKAFLMYPDRDFGPGLAVPANADELTQDLELDTLFDAMARGDALVRKVARIALLSSLVAPDEILYRQSVLSDCLRQPLVLRALFDLAGEAIAAEKAIFRSFFSERPETLLGRSVKVLEMFVGMLKRLRQLGDEHADQFSSEGFTRFYLMLGTELDDDYFAVIEHHLTCLRFPEGQLTSVRLGEGNRGVDDVLREPREQNRGFFKRAPVKKPAYTMTIPDRDDNGLRALSDVRDRGLNVVANAAAQSADHVLSFFTALRVELAFYVGCLNLHEQLAGKGEPACFPVPTAAGERARSARGLYDPCLSLHLDGRAAGNDLDANDKSLIMITGANQGGKSTFLRSVGVAHLMLQAGMFVAAETFSASVVRALFTHFKREEDATMTSGKLDEELSRMSDIADQISPDCLLLCNESFAATNEREGSQIAREVVRAMVDGGITVFFVTHLFDLGHGLYERPPGPALFLRAERESDGHRSYRIAEGEPLTTSYGQDLYTRIFQH